MQVICIMKTKAIYSFFVLFAIVAGIGATTPAAFADHTEVTIETADTDLATPFACGETEVGCYTPSTVTVDVGGVITMTNVDAIGIHTFTSGTVDGSVPSPDGVFDSGVLTVDQSFEYTADTAGEIPYYCTLHTWMQGMVVVEEAAAEEEMMAEETAEEEMMAEEIMVSVETGMAGAGESLTVDITFSNMDGSGVEHTNYDIVATQDGQTVLEDTGVHSHDGTGSHTTMALSAAASDASPVDVTVTFQGFGIDPPFTGPIGQVATKQVVPEFGTIAVMILGVAIVSIIAFYC